MVGVVYHQQNIVIAQGVDDPVFGQFAGAVDIIIGKKTGPAGAYGDQQIAGGGFLPRLWHHQDDIGNAEPAIGVAAVNGGKAPDLDEFDMVDALYKKTGFEVPKPLASLKSKKVRFNNVCSKGDMSEMVFKLLEL